MPTSSDMIMVGGDTVKFADSTPAEGEERKPPAFSMLAYSGGKMRPVGRTSMFVVDLAGLRWPTNGVTARMNHDPNQGVGWIDSIKSDGRTLAASGRITRKTSAAMDVLESARDGHPWQASIFIDFTRDDTELIEAGKKKTINGQVQEGPFVHVKSARLAEISFVDAGADPNTLTHIAAMAGGQTGDPDMPSKAKDGTTDETQTKTDEPTTSKAPATPRDDAGFADDAPDYIAQARQRARDEIEVDKRCQHILAGNPRLVNEVDSIRCAALDGTITMDDFKRKAKQLASNMPLTPGQSEQSTLAETMECAMCMVEMLPNIEKHFDERTLQRADDMIRSEGFGLRRLLYKGLKANGIELNEHNTDALVRAAFSGAKREDARFNMSTVDLPTLLSNVANKFIAQAFLSDEEQQNAWRNVAMVRSVRDYKTNTLATIGLNQGMQDLAPGGEIQHTTPLETSYTVRAKTRASMLSINHEIIANDDLGEIARLSQEFAANALDDLARGVWTTFMANPSNFFHANNGNLYEDAAAALSIDSFSVVRTLLRKQTKPNGEILNIRPRFLIVPPELLGVARQLQSTTTIAVGVGSSAKVQGRDNPWAQTFETIESVYLSDSTITGNSEKAWYLTTDPSRLASVIVAFRDGRQTPTVETADADFKTLGIRMRCVFDWGTAKGEYRAVAKSKGEA